MIVAIFSDGGTFEYRGTRPVTHGWIIYTPDGRTKDNGFSKDIAAAKLAIKDRLKYLKHHPSEYSNKGWWGKSQEGKRYFADSAKMHGFKTVKEWQEHCTRENEKEAARYTSEIVPIS